jgi:hypothetical protein
LVEHLLCKQGVRGSTPLVSTRKGKPSRNRGFFHLTTPLLFEIETKNSSGYYHRLVRNRPEGLATGILQGAPLEYWWVAKDPALIQIMVQNQKLKDEMKAAMIKELEDSQGTLFDL